MVGVVGSSPIAPTINGIQIKHLAETLGAFFMPVRISDVLKNGRIRRNWARHHAKVGFFI